METLPFLFIFRWRVAMLLIRAALWLTPRGSARYLLDHYIGAWGKDITRAVQIHYEQHKERT